MAGSDTFRGRFRFYRSPFAKFLQNPCSVGRNTIEGDKGINDTWQGCNANAKIFTDGSFRSRSQRNSSQQRSWYEAKDREHGLHCESLKKKRPNTRQTSISKFYWPKASD
uniref:RNase H domain-containing protein n=1 Tax=Haemonchus placei TaxID=6290 RepID=A0A0N4W892_HAEPC